MNDSRTAVVRGGDVGSPQQYTRVARLDPDLHWVIRSTIEAASFCLPVRSHDQCCVLRCSDLLLCSFGS